jgi:hypothetical protein
MFWISEDGVVFLCVERDVPARMARVTEVSRDDPDFTFPGTHRGLFVLVEPQVVCRSWERCRERARSGAGMSSPSCIPSFRATMFCYTTVSWFRAGEE